MNRDKNEGKLYRLVDLLEETDDAGPRLKALRKNVGELMSLDRTKPMRAQIAKLRAANLVCADRCGGFRWTPEGRRALCQAMTEDKEEAVAKGLPWPPSPTYFRDMRRLNDENQNHAPERLPRRAADES